MHTTLFPPSMVFFSLCILITCMPMFPSLHNQPLPGHNLVILLLSPTGSLCCSEREREPMEVMGWLTSSPLFCWALPGSVNTIFWNSLSCLPVHTILPSPPLHPSNSLFSYPPPMLFACQGITGYFSGIHSRSELRADCWFGCGRVLGGVQVEVLLLINHEVSVCFLNLVWPLFSKSLVLIYSPLVDPPGWYMYFSSRPTSWADCHIFIYSCCIVHYYFKP
jgi:hypothetical protein